jgi:hypothetical protein
MKDINKRQRISRTIACGAAMAAAVFAYGQTTAGQKNPVSEVSPKLVFPAGVEKLCTIPFGKDTRRPARVEDAALSCLTEIAKTLQQRPDRKVVLVGVSDPVKDHEERDNGKERMVEDKTGLDVRYEDIAAYRAVNTKAYLTEWFHVDPARILPTTNEGRHGQDVAFYLIPGDADFEHNYLNTTRTNELPCTVKPCYDKREETLSSQPRGQIPAQKPTVATK